MHQIRFRLRPQPRTVGGDYSASDSLAAFKRVYFEGEWEGEEEGRRGEKEKGRERRGREVERGIALLSTVLNTPLVGL